MVWLTDKRCLALFQLGHYQRFSSLQISDTPQVGFEPMQNLSSGFVEWRCAVMTTTTPWQSYKIGLVHTTLFRFFKIYSSMGSFHIEVEHLRSIFKCNNYPVNIIDQCIKKFLDKLYVPKQIVPTIRKRELLVTLPFLGTFSLNLVSNWLAIRYHNAI